MSLPRSISAITLVADKFGLGGRAWLSRLDFVGFDSLCEACCGTEEFRQEEPSSQPAFFFRASTSLSRHRPSAPGSAPASPSSPGSRDRCPSGFEGRSAAPTRAPPARWARRARSAPDTASGRTRTTPRTRPSTSGRSREPTGAAAPSAQGWNGGGSRLRRHGIETGGFWPPAPSSAIPQAHGTEAALANRFAL